jgi:hypothetical protein
MPGDPKECREHAIRCLELARTASSQEAKEKFISLAATWQHLAGQLEVTLAILESDAHGKELACSDPIAKETASPMTEPWDQLRAVE